MALVRFGPLRATPTPAHNSDGYDKYKSVGEGVLIKKECELEDDDNYSSSQSARCAADTDPESEWRRRTSRPQERAH